MTHERPLDVGQYVVENITTGFSYTSRTKDGLIGGWAATKPQAEKKAKGVFDERQ